MKVDLPTEQQVIKEGLKILSAHMAPVKFARFVVACQLGEGEYLLSKNEMFADETVDSLYEKVRDFEQGKT
ncbi:MAG: hypothetical protein HLUCCO16_15170 [Phormidium sp. OSCR]|nr:MAG: hypothetical protein HLUCCO16_15170 [Phormidium sp. OSCR]